MSDQLTQWARSLFNDISNPASAGNISTAARKDVPHEAGDGLGESLTEGAHPVRDTEAGVEPRPSIPHRRMTMTPLGPRTMGGLKGFGFTVTFEEPGNGRAGEKPVTAPRQAGEDTSDPASPAPDFRYRPVTTSVRRRG